MRGLSTSPPNPILPLYELATSPTQRPSQPSRASLNSIPYRDSPSAPSSPSLRNRELYASQATSRQLRSDSPASRSSTTGRSLPPHSLAPAPLLFSQPTTASEAELLALARQAAHISKTLQHLLDAQSQGLLAGLAGEVSSESLLADDRSDPATPTPFSSQQPSRSSTPTLFPRSSSPTSTSSLRSRNSTSERAHASRRRSPPPRITLHAARARIPRTLLSLSDLKVQETSILSTSLTTLNTHLDSLAKHEKRRDALGQKITSLSSDPSHGTPSIERLEAQEQAFSHEILELEDRLTTLRAKQRSLKGEIELKTNHLDAKISSYKTALEDADKDAQSRFLRSDPLSPSSSNPAQSSTSFSRVFPLSKPSNPAPLENQNTNVWNLPPSRRTLPLVRADLESRIAILSQRLQDSDLEARASAEGAQLWTAVLEILERTERVIKETMRRQHEVLGRGDVDEERRKAVLEGDTRTLVGVVEDASRGLREAEEVARERGWNFLVCAIGAEAEALARGREVLSGLLGDQRGEREQTARGSEEVEKAQSVQDLRKQPKVDDDRPSSAGAGSGRAKKTHGRQSSFPTFGWSRKASAVEPQLTRQGEAHKRDGGLDVDVELGEVGKVGGKEPGQGMAASRKGEGAAEQSVDREDSLLKELSGGEATQADDDELLRDLMSGGR